MKHDWIATFGDGERMTEKFVEKCEGENWADYKKLVLTQLDENKNQFLLILTKIDALITTFNDRADILRKDTSEKAVILADSFRERADALRATTESKAESLRVNTLESMNVLTLKIDEIKIEIVLLKEKYRSSAAYYGAIAGAVVSALLMIIGALILHGMK